jgi:hypothetical protein
VIAAVLLSAAAGLPARATVERIEAALAFWDDAAAVGLPGVVAASDAGRRWRVRVRDLACRPDGAAAACAYRIRPCGQELRWCARRRRFVRGEGFSGADGWVAEP